MMTRPELEQILRFAVNQGWITQAEADEILARYDAGAFTDDQLPFSLQDLYTLEQPPVGSEQDSRMLLLLGATGLLSLMALAGSARGVLDIMLRAPQNRAQLRNQLRIDFEAQMRSLVPLPLHEWQRQMVFNVQDYIYAQARTGAGRHLTPQEVARLRSLVHQQQDFIFRFGSERFVREASGNPMSQNLLLHRQLQYGGAGYGEWFRHDETGHLTNDHVVDYIDRDDPRVCGPCSRAASRGPYLPGQGPYPGQVCVAHGLCRCIRRGRFAPEEAARLRGER